MDEVYRFIEKEKLIVSGDTVVAGVSGGADSMCLLLLLLSYQKKCAFALRVVHVEHGIRGAESASDARFVEEYCRMRNIPCQIFYLDVPSYAKEHGIGMEEAARILRYDCYRQAAEAIAAEGVAEGKQVGMHVKIALAHHADDNAETILFQMVRGSGLRGLCGIRSKRMLGEQAMIIRPLLMVTREEIELYLQDMGQKFCVDSTNLNTDYSRNRIRHEVIPKLGLVNAQAVYHMTQAAGMLTELSDYLMYEVERIIPEVSTRKKNGRIIKEELFVRYPLALQKETVHYILCETAGSRKDIGSVHVEAVLELITRQVGRRISLSYQMEAVRDYEGICIRKQKDLQPQDETADVIAITQEQLEWAEAGNEITITLPDGEMRLRVRPFYGEMGEIQKKRYTKCLNYDKIKCGLLLRKRASGDYFSIDDKGHKKKLKDYFIGEKIPCERRNKIWLLADGAHIVWIVGERMSADYKIESNTKKILEVQIIGGDYYEDQED